MTAKEVRDYFKYELKHQGKKQYNIIDSLIFGLLPCLFFIGIVCYVISNSKYTTLDLTFAIVIGLLISGLMFTLFICADECFLQRTLNELFDKGKAYTDDEIKVIINEYIKDLRK